LRESSVALGALVGANFNIEAMSALYISQLIGQHLSLEQQLIVILTSVFASVGAANIPNAGLVIMTLVFTSVGLPTQYIALLVTIDWFLDRCRTAIAMGDITVSALLDGKKPRLQNEA
ncbi:MAG: cation:dicarboxylase symporter family transporter, partial [Nostoc sp. C3-bin3]|nr:cation:dicarboxylase symporter family transporter [Nostoc sp. C3-bin3]